MNVYRESHHETLTTFLTEKLFQTKELWFIRVVFVTNVITSCRKPHLQTWSSQLPIVRKGLIRTIILDRQEC